MSNIRNLSRFPTSIVMAALVTAALLFALLPEAVPWPAAAVALVATATVGFLATVNRCWVTGCGLYATDLIADIASAIVAGWLPWLIGFIIAAIC